VGAILDKTRLQGILRGTPSGEVMLEKVMSDETVPAGELVLTSGGDGIFPKGLLVGRVTKVSPGSELFLNIRVRPAADLSRLEEVLVVTKIDERQAEPDHAGTARAIDILAERLPTVPPKPENAAKGAAPGTASPGTVAPAAGAPTTGAPTIVAPKTVAPTAGAPTTTGAAAQPKAAPPAASASSGTPAAQTTVSPGSSSGTGSGTSPATPASAAGTRAVKASPKPAKAAVQTQPQPQPQPKPQPAAQDSPH
jgi:rod shape-determining protein MreC